MAVANKYDSASGGQAWFCTTGLPSDVIFQVRDMTFHLHKFPLMSKCGKIQRLIAEQDQNLKNRPLRKQPQHASKTDESIEHDKNRDTSDEIEEIVEEDIGQIREAYHISLKDFPGGPGTFESAAKFCYGVKINLTAWNVIPLRCAAEYLDMSEDLAEDNLISRTERYLNQSVLRHLSQASKALKSCDDLLPLADELGLVQRCVDSIAARVSTSDPALVFGWPVNNGGGTATTPSQPILWNGLDTGVRRRSGPRSSSAEYSWLEDISFLNLPMYKRVISAMVAQPVSSEALEASVVAYANRCIPGLSRSSRHHSSAPVVSETEQRDILETVITNLPQGKSRSGLASTRFLFRLLRTANILRASEVSRTALERKIGSQLERATVYDLLIPNYSYAEETLYDVECVERILKYFVSQLEGEVVEEEDAEQGSIRKLTRVGKLLDAYLAEIACDANLKADKFCELALALPEQCRVYDDGVYRAVDIYLKEHGALRGEERERVCGIVDCRKLTMEGCSHAAQNERLPLRAILQVLFFEQLQLRQAIAGTLILPPHQYAQQLPPGAPQERVREHQVLRLDMDSMRTRVHELERECSTIKKAIQSIGGHKEAPLVSRDRKDKKDKDKDKDKDRDQNKDKDKDSDNISTSSSSSAKRKGRYGGCRFSTQVCDSHERNVVESRTAARVQLSP